MIYIKDNYGYLLIWSKNGIIDSNINLQLFIVLSCYYSEDDASRR